MPSVDVLKYRRYFSEFLPSIVGELMIEDLKGLDCCVEIKVTDSDDAPWQLHVEKGRLVHVGHEGPRPTCRYVLDASTLVDVITARRAPQEAFFEALIDIEGDIEQGLQLSTILESFFERFPFKE